MGWDDGGGAEAVVTEGARAKTERRRDGKTVIGMTGVAADVTGGSSRKDAKAQRRQDGDWFDAVAAGVTALARWAPWVFSE